jgi:hypothetical protein
MPPEGNSADDRFKRKPLAPDSTPADVQPGDVISFDGLSFTTD